MYTLMSSKDAFYAFIYRLSEECKKGFPHYKNFRWKKLLLISNTSIVFEFYKILKKKKKNIAIYFPAGLFFKKILL